MNIKDIEDFFGSKFTESENSKYIDLKAENNKVKIHLEIFPENIPDEFLITVYTSNCHLQLHSCSKVIISKMLEEVIFFSENESTISGLIVSVNGDCAMYTNVDKKVISSDFGDLSSEKLLAAVALSVTESYPEDQKL